MLLFYFQFQKNVHRNWALFIQYFIANNLLDLDLPIGLNSVKNDLPQEWKF